MSNTTLRQQPRLLVANRGEIALRIIRTAAELGWSTVALCTSSDSSHAQLADITEHLADPGAFLDVQTIVDIAKRTHSTHVHPGYGFLSESPALSDALSSAGITFVGPSSHALQIASDKMRTRALAEQLGIPVARGMQISSPADVRAFAEGGDVGYPVMIKALDAGGGRRISAVSCAEHIEEAFEGCQNESPSHMLFVEQALVTPGWKHVEVQIVGDGTGMVIHLWERECSVQRRFQKIIEMAPSTLPRSAVAPLLEAALKMGSSLQYKGLGTVEFLVRVNDCNPEWVFLGTNPRVQVERTVTGTYCLPDDDCTLEWVFLGMNPRVQVGHTVTEEITHLDLIRTQLLLSLPSITLSSLSLSLSPYLHSTPTSPPPPAHAIQLRLTAEDPTQSFSFSSGHISARGTVWPNGRGVRVDTWLVPTPDEDGWTVGAEYDSLLAKIVVCGASPEEAAQRAVRALQELQLGSGEGKEQSVRTNVGVLAGVVAHPDWAAASVWTGWLEEPGRVESILAIGQGVLGQRRTGKTKAKSQHERESATSTSNATSGPGSVLLEPGSTFHLTLAGSAGPTHTLALAALAQNAHPETLGGTLGPSFSPAPLEFTLVRVGTGSTGVDAAGELADPRNRTHVAAPVTGRVEGLHSALLSGEGCVEKLETLAVMSAMGMESVVLAPSRGRVIRAGQGVRLNEVVRERSLLAVVEWDEEEGASE